MLLWPVTLSLPFSTGGSSAASDFELGVACTPLGLGLGLGLVRVYRGNHNPGPNLGAGVACAPLSSEEKSAWSLTCRKHGRPPRFGQGGAEQASPPAPEGACWGRHLGAASLGQSASWAALAGRLHRRYNIPAISALLST